MHHRPAPDLPAGSYNGKMLAFHPSGHNLAASGRDETIHLQDLATGQLTR